MKIHVFNPEHDLALAHNGAHFTAPHAARELRMNLGFLPALWAADGDIVLVDDVEFALKAGRRFRHRLADVLFMSPADLRVLGPSVSQVEVWGWDRAVRQQLLEAGVSKEQLPGEQHIDVMRSLSGRQTGVSFSEDLRRLLDSPSVVGRSQACFSIDEVERAVGNWGNVVLKSPWSSSGRGIKYVRQQLSESQQGWCRRVLDQQGAIVAEIYNNKVIDFGMEFHAYADGSVSYAGLSMFQTQNGAYAGSILASEAYKREMLSHYLPENLIDDVQKAVVQCMCHYLSGRYIGPFGVDMMVVAGEGGSEAKGFLLNPCVEVNLRRTMGHVALSLTPPVTEPRQLMRIVHEVNYELRLSSMENNFVKLL